MTSDDQKRATRCSACGRGHLEAEPCPGKGGARVGTTLEGKYELVRLLGQGGMGEVYEGRHTRIGRRVAVKFLHSHYALHSEIALRFENEAKTAGATEHENIAGVFDVGALPDGAHYLVMEYLDGVDLDRLLQQEGRLPLPRAADFVRQACLGLEVVHRRGIVHRDLKPANLFLTRRASGADLIKVLDFGIAKFRRTEQDAGSTKTGVALGTAHYMSPEQARGDRDIGTASDIYSLGAILYQLLSGKHPHDGDSLLQILHRILTQPPVPLEEVAPGLPQVVYAIVRKAMAMNVADRFSGVGELSAALAPFATEMHAASQAPPGFATRAETVAAVPAASPPSSPQRAPLSGTLVGGRSFVGLASSTKPPVGGRKLGATLTLAALAALAVAVVGFAAHGLRRPPSGPATLSAPPLGLVQSATSVSPLSAPDSVSAPDAALLPDLPRANESASVSPTGRDARAGKSPKKLAPVLAAASSAPPAASVGHPALPAHPPTPPSPTSNNPLDMNLVQ